MNHHAQRRREQVRKVPFPQFPKSGEPGWCRWCGERIMDEKTGQRSKRRTWHPECVHDYNLHARLETQFAHVEARDGLKCAWPGCGASPERWHNLGEIVEWVPLPRFGIPVADPRYMDTLRQWREANPCPVYCQIERRTALQLDHRVPLWSVADLPDHERRPYFGPGNLWLLCPDHHRAKTRREAAERAAAKRAATAQDNLFS